MHYFLTGSNKKNIHITYSYISVLQLGIPGPPERSFLSILQSNRKDPYQASYSFLYKLQFNFVSNGGSKTFPVLAVPNSAVKYTEIVPRIEPLVKFRVLLPESVN